VSIEGEPLEERLRAALQHAFGSRQADAIAPLAGGASSAFPFRVDIAGRRYVVRLEGERSPLRNPQQYASMSIAAAAGIAPRLYYADEALGVAVMDFIDARPLGTFPGGPPALARTVGELIARLQSGPVFPRFVDYPDIVGRLWAYLCGLFAPGTLDKASERLAHVTASYEAHTMPGVASHNDLLPRNLLFDGQRLWLIDWESAYCNDPHIDLAIALDNFAPDADCARALRLAAEGPRGGWVNDARLDLARALVRLYYAGVLLCASYAAQGALQDADLAAPSAAAFSATLRDGQIQADTPVAKHVLGKIFLASFMTGAQPPSLGGSA
jgi:predicted Ser/Thr protein kinase